ncbi:hypothetical protein [Zhihengliuella flava]|uniref:Uncharacterized protein n=1 Tax=Zhihengliuella flava TaxID=1285193 RepID=A0A931DE56_9MICC|nr:hypothetical protein [Zhihengliuella flava]MBG6085811.1 hypothetical protein [Zhihengliuella flava]
MTTGETQNEMAVRPGRKMMIWGFTAMLVGIIGWITVLSGMGRAGWFMLLVLLLTAGGLIVGVIGLFRRLFAALERR